MDYNTDPLIFVSLFVVAMVCLFLSYKFGMKKKSFEEALAEHRKQTNALLGPKPKPKDKKNKKALKKINKEKLSGNGAPETDVVDDTESLEVRDVSEKPEKAKLPQQTSAKSSSKQSKIHVEFKEEPESVPEEVLVEKEVKEVINKKRVKKVRPILVKKGSNVENPLPADIEIPVVNHFEELHPKDECELLHSLSKEDLHKQETTKEEKKTDKPSKKSKNHKPDPKQEVEKSTTPTELPPTEKEKTKEEKSVENIVAPVVQDPVNTGKEKKKKKSEFNARQQITAERDQLIHSVRNAELSRTEVQLLIDLLLNKQLEAPAVIDEWSEGRYDPVQKLKKQLSEKEKLLADKEDALVSVQAKLKEVRNEQLTDKAQLQLKVRAAEEAKLELTAAVQRLQLKVQEAEEVRGKDVANFQRVLDDNKALQMQRGQLEAALIKYQETDALIHNLKTENTHLSNELQRFTQELQEQGTNYQNCVIQIRSLQDELDKRHQYVIDLERNNSFNITAQLEEKRALSEMLQKERDNAAKEEEKLLAVIEQLKSENQKLQEEKTVQMNGSTEDNKIHEVKLLNLTNQLSSVKSELSCVNQKFKDAESRYQSELESSNENFNKLKTELEEQKNKNNELRKKNWKVMEALNAAENRNKPAPNVDQIKQEIKLQEQDAQKQFLQRLFPEIDDLKSVSTDDWQAESGRLIKHYVSTLQQPSLKPENSSEVEKLRSEIKGYKEAIDNTETMLLRLQSHIEQEERKWRDQLTGKNNEIQELKNKCVHQLQSKVSSLEKQLAEEQQEKQRLAEERQTVGTKSLRPGDPTAIIEKLSQEVDRLNEQLRIAQTNKGDLSVLQNGQTSS